MRLKVLTVSLVLLALMIGLPLGMSSATTIGGMDRPSDFVVIPPPIENTIDCSTIPNLPYGMCMGTEKNDKMMGDSTREIAIWPENGDDYVLGGEGPESGINGGNGNDLLYGEEGKDTISGGNGTDRIYGGPGNDYIQVGTVFAPDGHWIGNETDLPPYKDFVDCGQGYDQVVIDDLDVYQNCEVVYQGATWETIRDITNLTRFP
jgi:hypothetical protein